jgi:hypothetical protein
MRPQAFSAELAAPTKAPRLVARIKLDRGRLRELVQEQIEGGSAQRGERRVIREAGGGRREEF